MKAHDFGGLIGVVMMLGAYVGAQNGRLDPTRAPSLLLNFGGACLVMISLIFAFNLAAFVTEAAWAGAAAIGLARLALRKA